MQPITANERELAFVSKLKCLLEASGAELEVTDDGREYGMQSGVCIISMDAIYDKDGNKIKDFTVFELPNYMP